MSIRRVKPYIGNSLFAIIFAGLLWQSFLLYTEVKNNQAVKSLQSIEIDVYGNVERPGKYRIPVGTTTFEILQVAGMRNTSDITPFNLTAQVEPGQNMDVGTLASPVGINNSARLEFYLGDVSVISSDGIDRLVNEGMVIDQGDRILTEEDSQAELSYSTYSRIDMDNFSELTFDKIAVDSAGGNVTEIFQKTGTCWYKIAYEERNEQFKTFTPLANITVAGNGADFTIEVKYSEMVINVLDGLLLVERTDGSDAINLITGQSVVIYNDQRPFQVTKISSLMGLTDQFKELTRAKTEMLMKHMPLNFLFCNPPITFFLFSIQFNKGVAHIVHVPHNTSVEFFTQGLTTMQEAFLYGGGVYMSTLVERIMNTRITKYIVLDKGDIIRIGSSIGGIKVVLDEKAASALNKKSGNHKIKGQDLITFLSPSVSGLSDCRVRQFSILKELSNQVKSKDVVLTALLVDQVLTNVETNIAASEVMGYYNNYMSRKNWTFKDYVLPLNEIKKGNKTLMEPDLKKCRELLFAD